MFFINYNKKNYLLMEGVFGVCGLVEINIKQGYYLILVNRVMD